MCDKDAIIENIKRRGSVVKVFLYCVDEHHTTWISQPRDNPKGENNLRLAAGVLFSANTFARIRSFLKLVEYYSFTNDNSIDTKKTTCLAFLTSFI